MFSWDFGKVPIKHGSKPRKITLTLKNIGGVSSDWCFKMPNDSEIEMETWADPGEPSTEQAFEKDCLLYTSPSPRDRQKSRMPSSA